MPDSLQALEAAGIATGDLPEEQRQVLASLSDDEVRVITSVKSRLDEAAGDVQGYAMPTSGGLRDTDGGVIY